MLFFQQSPANFNRKTERIYSLRRVRGFQPPSRIKPDSPYLPGQTRGDKPCVFPSTPRMPLLADANRRRQAALQSLCHQEYLPCKQKIAKICNIASSATRPIHGCTNKTRTALLQKQKARQSLPGFSLDASYDRHSATDLFYNFNDCVVIKFDNVNTTCKTCAGNNSLSIERSLCNLLS